MLPKHLKLYYRKHARKHLPTVIEQLCHKFSLKDLRKATNNFDDRLRTGFIGSRVYKGCLNFNGVTNYEIAIRRIHGRNSHRQTVEFKNEIEVLCQLNHPNLVSLIGFCDHKDEMILVYKYESNRSLDKHLFENDHDKPLSWKKRLEICIGIARGLHYLHSGTKRTIFHRDIKPRNILLDNNMVPKISGFDLHLKGPKFMSKPESFQVESVAGTLFYLAPEHYRDGTFTDKSDVYSFGMVLHQVVCAMEPYTFLREGIGSPFEENIYSSLKGKIAPECWNVFVDIMKRCLNYDPNERPMMGEVEVELEHALSLQEEADIKNANANACYTLLTTTIINLGGDQVQMLLSESEDSETGRISE